MTRRLATVFMMAAGLTLFLAAALLTEKSFLPEIDDRPGSLKNVLVPEPVVINGGLQYGLPGYRYQ